jgi:hypothetical protein
MPRYFFHLRFGQLVLSDEEGIELSNRTAARDEALAVVRDLADPEIEGSRRRWAGWFLQVEDEQGQFFGKPIGHPALEIVTPDFHAEEPRLKPTESAVTGAQRRVPVRDRQTADIDRELSPRRQQVAQLIEHSRRLQHELSSLCLVSNNLRARARDLVAYARQASGGRYDIEVFRRVHAVARP